MHQCTQSRSRQEILVKILIFVLEGAVEYKSVFAIMADQVMGDIPGLIFILHLRRIQFEGVACLCIASKELHNDRAETIPRIIRVTRLQKLRNFLCLKESFNFASSKHGISPGLLLMRHNALTSHT